MTDKKIQIKIEEKQLVVFSIAKEEFGIDISELKEIVKIMEITPVPNVEDYIKGVINLRGRIIVLILLAKKLNLEIKKEDKDSRILIMESGENIFGMIVDKVDKVLRVGVDKISAAPEIMSKEISSDYIKGVCVLGERLIILLDLIKLLNLKDIEKINKLDELKN